MGDLIGKAVTGTLYWVPLAELERVRALPGPRFERAALFADACRLNALYMIARAGSGHIGSSFSSLDLVSLLYLEELGPDDVYFSSKGHDAPGLYAVLLGLGRLPFEKIHELRKLGGLPGHPDVGTPGIVTNTGSLGMGISKAKGMVLAKRRLEGEGPRVRADGRRRASGRANLGIAAVCRQPANGGSRRDRRSQQAAIRSVGVARRAPSASSRPSSRLSAPPSRASTATTCGDGRCAAAHARARGIGRW